VVNTGDMTDEAIFDFVGLSGTATRTLSFKGMVIDGPILIPKGWGAFNESTGTFYFDGNSPLIGSTNDSTFDKIVANGLVDSHKSMPYYAIVTLEIVVSSGAVNGAGGLLEMVVTSVANAANRSGKIAISLSVETNHKVGIESPDGLETNITFGEIGKPPIFEITLSNIGNVESEFIIFSSPGVRGWTVQLYANGPDCQKNGSRLLCTLQESESIIIYAKVNPPVNSDEVEDSFKFVISAEPTEKGLSGRVNLELTVNGEPEEFAFNSLITPNILMGIAAIVLVGLALLTFRRRR
jgi:hypothetical protein